MTELRQLRDPRVRRPAMLATVFAMCVALGASIASPATALSSGEPLSLPFPRVAHVWPSGSYTNADAARYDYLVLPWAGRNDALRALNPDIILLTDTQASNACEVCVDPNQPVTAEVNRTMAKISARWILTQVGTSLSSAITATTTTIPVSALTTGSLALFKVGELVVIEGEICRVDGIGTSTLTVKRGVVFPAAAHAAGTRIAATISTYAQSVNMDLTANCPKVTVDPNVGPETWAEWNARAAAARASDPTWDGIYIDRANGNPASTFLNNGARSIDPNRSNTLVTDSYTAFNAAWNAGQLSFQRALRTAIGSDKLILGNGSIQNYGVINGSLIESFPQDNTSATKWRQWVVGPAPDTFGSYFDWLANSREPDLSTVLTYQVDGLPGDGMPPNYRKMRLGLTTALLADGFFMYGKGTPALAWFDEYDNAGAGKGYLGQPLGSARLANPELTTPDLIVGDGAFSTIEQFTRWPLYLSGTGYAATKSLDGAAARIDVTAAGGSPYRVSLQHKNIPVSAGTRYTATFRARADRPRTMLLGFYTASWNELTNYQTIALDTSWKTFELPYTVSGTDPAAMMCFMLGKEIGTVWIDDVKLQTGSRQDLYRRDFEHGVVLVNPTDVVETVQLGGTFRKINGTQDRSVNDGSLVTQVTLPPKDGIVLLRDSVTVPTPPDTTKPTVSMTAPASGATVSGSVALAATASDNVGVTRVEFRVDGTLVLSDTAAPYAATWNATGAAPGTHTITATAYDAAGNSSVATVSVTVPTPADTTAPSAPTGVSATAISTTSIKVSWTASSDASGIQEYRVYSGGALKATVTGTNATVTGLVPSTLYSFTVVAADNAGNVSVSSASASATTLALPDTTAPTAPTGVTASALSTTSIKISWTASSDASGIKEYRVYMNGALKATVTGTAATVAGLAPSTTYSYTVVAVDNAGNVSAASASASATTLADASPPSPPSNISAAKLGSNSVRVSWGLATDSSGVSDVKEYRVYDVRTDSLVATIPHPGITATVYGLSPNTRYGYYVKAVDNANNVSAASLVAYAKTDRVVVRLKGTDRYATAVMTSQEAYPTGTETVIVATGTNWPDALGGSALAGALDAPILLTRQGALPSEVVSEIRRLKATKAIVLGGASAVSASVEATLKNMLGQGNVERIAGANRYETADRIAAKTIALLGDAFDGTAFVATGVNFPDALGASPLAAAGGWPIYLANPNQGANAGLAAVMRSAGIKRTVVLGGTNVVASSVETSLRGLGSVTRLAGANRYDTAVKTAAWGVANAGLSWDKVAVATGQTFPDALAGGVLQGASDSVMLLTPAKALAQGPAAALAANEATIMEVRYLGAAPAAVW